jgi:hypothetical protein
MAGDGYENVLNRKCQLDPKTGKVELEDFLFNKTTVDLPVPEQEKEASGIGENAK